MKSVKPRIKYITRNLSHMECFAFALLEQSVTWIGASEGWRVGWFTSSMSGYVVAVTTHPTEPIIGIWESASDDLTDFISELSETSISSLLQQARTCLEEHGQ